MPRMGTMNFSIPDGVKEAFNKAFEGENKSAVITRLMVRAIEEEERTRRSRDFVERLRQIRARGRPVTEAVVPSRIYRRPMPAQR